MAKIGFVDSIKNGLIRGWAVDEQNPESPAVVDVCMNGVVVATVSCSEFRPDLVDNHIGNGYHGFSCRFQEGKGDLAVRFAAGGPVLTNGERVLAEREPVIIDDGLSTPLPPENLVFLVNGHTDLQQFGAGRRLTVNNIIDLLATAAIDHKNFDSILDFGCGCGRVLAGWEGLLPRGARLAGVDINPDLISFCQNNIHFAETSVCNVMPPLKYRNQSFDFIYAASVFTHMELAGLIAWTGEMARLLKPNGIVMLSFHGSWFGSVLAQLSREGSRQLAERGYYVHLHGRAEETFEGSNNYATFASADFMISLFKGFSVRAVYPGVSHGPNPFASYQDIAIFERLEEWSGR